ncbi:MAG: adenylate/guanylate cyclase domain-containing protein, partial [Chloroflexi bacterium]
MRVVIQPPNFDQHPTGTVTFLFTDIEGSTKLARKFPEIWSATEKRHHAILQTAISSHHGYVFRTIGDEFNAAFETAHDALSAALAAQRLLHTEDWGAIGSIRVRMGLHTGLARHLDGDYEGYLTLSHTKRLMSIAFGNQILLSEATEALLRDSLPQDITLHNLGEHRLKDFDIVEHIFQAVAQDLPADFPPLKSLEGSTNHLPVILTSFVGRSKEVGEVKRLLSKERIVTLTGPGGTGKTRLALQVAGEMIEQFQDGIFFVGLTHITDSVLITSTIAQALGITESPMQPIIESLKDYLRRKSLLLLLDNFEQVISAAPLVADLVVECSQLKIFVTSREALHISGEHEYPVPPLALPDLEQLPPVESLTQYAAVELFIQRALAVKPDFQIRDETAKSIVEICYRLDGLPLAIELAAARVKLLPPQAMLARLEHRLEFLTGGARDLPVRQQTLRNTIAWSHDLLNENEQRLFRRLSVFVGGCTIAAVETVAGDNPTSVSILDCLGSLLDKSLLRETNSTNNEPRFELLEMLREFGLEQLGVSGEQETIQRRHANYFLALAGQAEAGLDNVEQVQWMNQMEQEHDNLRAALEWSKTAEDSGEICLRLASILGLFWEARGYLSEGRERLAAVLLIEKAQGRTAARAMLLARAAELAYRQSDYPATESFARESLEIYREVGDKQGIASALIKLGNAATEVGNYATASEFLEEALTIWCEGGDKHGTSRALISLGWTALRSGDYDLANLRLEEALAISRESEDIRRIGFELSGLGEVAMRQGDYFRAKQLVEESLELRRQLGNKWGVG